MSPIPKTSTTYEPGIDRPLADHWQLGTDREDSANVEPEGRDEWENKIGVRLKNNTLIS
ncbi:MAG: hypothetical protein ACK5NG_08680 [Chthoniobacterales bacterium]